MAASPLTPSTAAEEIFDDTFLAEAFDLQRVTPLETPFAFNPVAFSIVMRRAYRDDGLVPPLELIVAAPNGRHTLREIAEVPAAVLFTPDAGGDWQITLREQAHNRWYAVTSVTVVGDPSA